jgi:hypothetical protein
MLRAALAVPLALIDTFATRALHSYFNLQARDAGKAV